MGKILDNSEKDLADMIISDHIEGGGDDINIYSQNRERSTIDPLYGEFKNEVFDGPWRIPAWIKWPAQEPSATQEGWSSEYDGMVTVARISCEERNMPYPSEGDIIEMWRTPYHDATSKGKGLFFDVIKVNFGGNINDTATFVRFRLFLKRRSQYVPERKLG